MARFLIVQNHPFALMGTTSLVGYLRKSSHDCDLVISNSPGRIRQAIARFRPDLIGFSCLTGHHKWALSISGIIKSWDKKNLILFGGVHPTFCPEILENEQIDFICRGEGEYPIRGLLDYLDKKTDLQSVPGIGYKQEGEIRHNPLPRLIGDLDCLPFPDRSIYYNRYKMLKNHPAKYFISSRGCPFKCSYCCNEKYSELYRGKGQWTRRKSVEYFINEIKDVRSRYSVRSIRFDDEVFILDPAWTDEFLERYKSEISIPFWVNATASLVNDETGQKLKEAGCHYVSFAMESGDETYRRNVLAKPITNENLMAASQSLRKIGIDFALNCMIGLPGETLDQAFETVKLARKLKPKSLVCSLFQPYPSAPIFDYAVSQGYISKEDIEDIGLDYHSHSILRQENIKQLDNVHKLFHVAVMFPRLEPIIKKLIKLPSNPVFMIVHRISYFVAYKRTTGASFVKALMMAIRTQVAFCISKSISRRSIR